jgi:hypothetical protein
VVQDDRGRRDGEATNRQGLDPGRRKAEDGRAARAAGGALAGDRQEGHGRRRALCARDVGWLLDMFSTKLLEAALAPEGGAPPEETYDAWAEEFEQLEELAIHHWDEAVDVDVGAVHALDAKLVEARECLEQMEPERELTPRTKRMMRGMCRSRPWRFPASWATRSAATGDEEDEEVDDATPHAECGKVEGAWTSFLEMPDVAALAVVSRAAREAAIAHVLHNAALTRGQQQSWQEEREGAWGADGAEATWRPWAEEW